MSEHSQLRKALEQPPLKKIKVIKNKLLNITFTMTTIQVGQTQENGTLTDPDILGSCEPGTSINLDGIIWNETKGGKHCKSV